MILKRGLSTKFLNASFFMLTDKSRAILVNIIGNGDLGNKLFISSVVIPPFRFEVLKVALDRFSVKKSNSCSYFLRAGRLLSSKITIFISL